MRTTLDLETDVLSAAKEIARQKRVSVGKVVSELVRQALTGSTTQPSKRSKHFSKTGFNPFPARDTMVTNELIDQLRDIEGV